MKYQLFVSGTPGDYESFPKGDEHASEYCKQFFNLPSNDTFHSADYYVELFPMDKLVYYSLMHRKNVSSTRENAYLALTLKFSGCYVEDVKSVFSLLEIVYNNYVLGNVIDYTGIGEKYKCQSLASFESLRIKAESEMGSTLNMLGKSVKEFDSSFSAKRLPNSKQLWYLDEGKQAIALEMKSVQKLHLIPTWDGFEEFANRMNGQIGNLNTQINSLNAQITSQTATIGDLNLKISSSKQTVKEKDDAYAKLTKLNKDLEEKLRNVPKPTPEIDFRSKVLTSLNGIENDVHVVKEQTKRKEIDRNNYEDQVVYWKKWLPWGLFLIASILCAWFAFKRVNIGDSSQSKSLRRENDSLMVANNRLNIELSKSNDSIINLKLELRNANEILDNIRGIVDPSKDNQKPPFLDVNGASDGNVTLGNHKITPKRMPNGADWVVKNCDPVDCATKNGDILKCNRVGSFTIVVRNGNEEIGASARKFTIIE